MAMDARYVRGLLDASAPAGSSPFDHRVWVFAGDGCLQEGITSEASSLAGHQELGNLVVLYDDNHISIEGDTALSFSEDVLARYAAYGWNIDHVDMRPDGSIVITFSVLPELKGHSITFTPKPDADAPAPEIRFMEGDGR